MAVPQDTSELLGGITRGEIRRMMSEVLDKALDKSFDEMKINLDSMSENIDRILRATDQRSAGADHDAQQPRFATMADVPTDTKNRKRTEDAVVDQAKHVDSCSAKRVDAGPPMCLTSFGDDSTDPLALPCCRHNALVDKGAAAPKPCLSAVEVRTLTATGGYFPPTQPLQRRETSFTSCLFGSARPKG